MWCAGSRPKMSALKRSTAQDRHRVIDPAEAEGSENNRDQERGDRKAKARTRAKVGEACLKRPLQFKKSPTATKKEHLTCTFFLVGQCWNAARGRVLLESSPRQFWLKLVRKAVAKQEMIARSSLWRRCTFFSWNRRTGDHVIHQVAKCLELSEDKMCIMHRASLMAARHHRLEMTMCFRGVHQSICGILVIAGGGSRQEESKQS